MNRVSSAEIMSIIPATGTWKPSRDVLENSASNHGMSDNKPDQTLPCKCQRRADFNECQVASQINILS